MSEVLLDVRSVGIRFGGLKALTGFSLQIRRGDLQGLIGPNGAGKTTAFNALTGVYAPSEGEVFVGDEKVNGKRPFQINRMGLARTFQNIRLFKELTALDNVRVAVLAERQPWFNEDRVRRLRRSGSSRPGRVIGGLAGAAFGGALWLQLTDGRFAPAALGAAGGAALGGKLGASWRSALGSTLDAVDNYRDWWRAFLRTPGFMREETALTARADELLSVMGLSHRRDELAKNLPYGEQRRLEIARALGTRPKVLLLDEPAAGMNTREKADLMVLIRQLKDQFSLGILVIEHDMKLVMGICEHITVLDHGETIATGAPASVRADPKVIEAYLGEAPAAAVPSSPAPQDVAHG